MTGTVWSHLREELDCWSAQGLAATLWWRDDDAVEVTPALERLLRLAERSAVPMTLAVIPEGVTSGLRERLADQAQVQVSQHGYSHRNHAPPDSKKMELAACRPQSEVLAELAAGRDTLRALFGTRALPVLVPPWNRIAAALVVTLPGLGYRGLSTFGPRRRRLAGAGLRQVNTHLDPIDWRGSAGFVGEQAALEQALAHLRARRAETVDRAEPTGLLTHHLRHDEAIWQFCERFLAATAPHPAARWLTATEAFELAPTRRAQ